TLEPLRLECAALKAGIAQLVEHDLAKVGVASSSLVSRSSFSLFFNDFGAIAKRLCTGLQIHVGRFDSGSRLQDFGDPTLRRTAWQEAPVVKLVDTRDLKSLGLTAVPVRFRPGAPFKTSATPLHDILSPCV